jgi:hypothetical protein
MLATSRAIGFDATISEDMPTCVTETFFWNNTHSRPTAAESFTMQEKDQETCMNPLVLGIGAKAHKISYHGDILTSVAFTGGERILLKSPIHSVEPDRMVLDPSSMEVGVPYRLDAFGAIIWAVKDGTDDVVFFELGE